MADRQSPPASSPAGRLTDTAVGAFLDSIIENIPDMIFVKDARELRFVRFNRAGEELLGYKREELIGKNDYDFFPKEEADFFVSRDRAVMESGQLQDIPEEPIHTRFKGTRLLHTKKIPILGNDGTRRYLLGISEDITDRRRAERAEAELHQSRNLESIGRLAGGVAHDFNNLITGILGVVAELKESATPEQIVDLDEIARAGERASHLTRQLLAFGRRQVLAPRVLDFNAAVRSVEPLLRRLIGADITLEFKLAPHVGCCRMDPGQLEQVILNLALNARDAMPQGGVLAISTMHRVISQGSPEPHQRLHPGDYVQLVVEDNGAGMAPETLAHAFEPFFSTKSREKGTGLGLATVYGIVKQNEGDVQLQSAPHAGTRVYLWLPRITGNSEGRCATAAEAPVGHETILVVEDEDLVRRTVVHTLKNAGYTVLQAAGGEEGLAVAFEQTKPIDLLLTDVIMPGLNGRQLAAKVNQRSPQTRVLFMSGYAHDLFIERDVLRPGVAFLAKSFTPEILRRKVREVLD